MEEKENAGQTGEGYGNRDNRRRNRGNRKQNRGDLRPVGFAGRYGAGNGRYEIRTTLGNGGFGITYKAWDYRLQRFVAIKEFFPDGFAYRDAGQSREVRCIQDAQTFQHGKHRFQKEAQLLAKLDFSHIVRVHDSFEEIIPAIS